MYTTIDKKVKMIALFDGGRVIPRIFRWQNRDHKVREVSISYREREGRSVSYYFGIETEDGGVFKLKYNDQQLIWTLLEVWSG